MGSKRKVFLYELVTGKTIEFDSQTSAGEFIGVGESTIRKYNNTLKDKLGGQIPVDKGAEYNKTYHNDKLTSLVNEFNEKHDNGDFLDDESGIASYQKKIKEQQEITTQADANYEKAMADGTLQNEEKAKKDLKHISDRIEQLRQFRKDLTSKDTQSKIKQVMKGIEDENH